MMSLYCLRSEVHVQIVSGPKKVYIRHLFGQKGVHCRVGSWAAQPRQEFRGGIPQEVAKKGYTLQAFISMSGPLSEAFFKNPGNSSGGN